MNQLQTTNLPDLTQTIDSLVTRYGTWRVVRAALLSVRPRPRATPISVQHLSARMRQDIGLDPPRARPGEWADTLHRELGPHALPHERRIWDMR